MELNDLQTGEWRKIYLPEASCAVDGDYCFHVRRGDASRLMIYLCGGGVSWDRDSAKWPSVPETSEKNGHVGCTRSAPTPDPKSCPSPRVPRAASTPPPRRIPYVAGARS